MNKQILLSPELRAKVEKAVEAAFTKCEKYYKQKFKRPEIRYNIRNTNGGEAWLQRNLIRLNLTFLVENEADFLASTVPHEVAHLVAHHVYDQKPMNGKKVRPHGKEWKEVMGVLDLEPKVKHTYNIASLDIVKVKRKRAMKSTAAKIAAVVKQISKFEHADREFIRLAIEEMGDE